MFLINNKLIFNNNISLTNKILLKLLQKFRSHITRLPIIRKSSTLLTGAVLSQLIAFAFLPIITAKYSPEFVGIGASFISISSILSVFFTMQFHSAIFIPKEKKDSYGLTILSLSVSVAIFIILYFLFFFFGEKFLESIGLSVLIDWIFFIPLLAFFLSIIQIFNNWFAKEEHFKIISINSVTQSSIYNSLAVLLNSFFSGAGGLIISKLAAVMLAGFKFIILFWMKPVMPFSTSSILKLSYKFKRFPQIGLPHIIFSTAVRDLPVLIIAGYFDPSLAGLYFIALKFSQLPMQILSKALYSVLIVEFADAINKKSYYINRLKWFLIISIPLTLILIILTPIILELMLDDSYSEASKFLYILIPLYYFKLLSSTFSQSSLIVHQELGFNFVIGFLIFLSTLIAFYVGYIYQNLLLAILIQTVLNIMLIIFKLVIAYKIIR